MDARPLWLANNAIMLAFLIQCLGPEKCLADIQNMSGYRATPDVGFRIHRFSVSEPVPFYPVNAVDQFVQ